GIMMSVTAPADLILQAIARNPDGQRFLSPLLARFSEAHWGAVRVPGTLRPLHGAPLVREIPLPPTFAAWAAGHPDEVTGDLTTSPGDAHVRLTRCLETDAFVLAIEDATTAPLDTGTPAYAARHRLSRVIEAVRSIADGRLFAVAIVAPPGFV